MLDMSDQSTFSWKPWGLQSAMKELSINSGTTVTWDDEETFETNISVVPGLEMASDIINRTKR